MVRQRVSLIVACALLQCLNGSAWSQIQPRLPQNPQSPQNPQNPPKPVVPTPPVRRPIPPTLPHRVYAPGLTVTRIGWRTGFTPYPGVTYTRRFRYHHYISDWTDDATVFLSPFYFYANLPPFLDGSAVQNNSDQDDSGDGQVESNPPQMDPDKEGQTKPDAGTSDSNPTGDLDPETAVKDLKHVWEGFDTAALAKLCPTDGNVKVRVAGQTYDLAAADFVDLVRDGVTGTQTVSWTITDEADTGDQIRLQAVHSYQDPWDKTRKVTQNYLLIKGDSGYVIREFGSEPYQAPADQNDDIDG